MSENTGQAGSADALSMQLLPNRFKRHKKLAKISPEPWKQTKWMRVKIR